MLFLQLPPVHSPSTARPPDPDIRSRSSMSSLLPCYFCSSRPSTARPQPVHRPSTGSWHSHRILTFALAPPSLASSHAISAAPARPQPVHRPSTALPCYFCSSRPSTARPPPVHHIRTFALAPPSLASSHAISAAPARPQPVHRIRTFSLAPPALASSHAISAAPARPQPARSSVSSLLPCYFCSSGPSTAGPPPVHRIRTFALAPPSLASSHAISAAPARPQARPPPVHHIRTFALAPPSLASSHAISAAPARPQPRPSTACHRPSTGSGHSLSLLP